MKKIISIIAILVYFLTPASAQTFFETAAGDGVIIGIDSQDIYQVKVTSSSSSLSAGLYKKRGLATAPVQTLFNATFKIKPNDDGVATLFKKGKIEPGINVSVAGGIRLNDCLGTPYFTALDIYIKPAYRYSSAKLFDSVRASNGQSPIYDTAIHSIGGDLLVNFCMSPEHVNLFFGAQIGVLSTTNIEDLDEVSVQTIRPVTGNTNNYVLSDIKKGKIGKVERITTAPLKIDMIVDPQIHLFGSGTTNATMGFLGYFRREFGKEKPTSRIGLGVCLLNARNPSKVFSSIGYEFPEIGGDDPAKFVNGTVFMSIGYTIL